MIRRALPCLFLALLCGVVLAQDTPQPAKPAKTPPAKTQQPAKTPPAKGQPEKTEPAQKAKTPAGTDAKSPAPVRRDPTLGAVDPRLGMGAGARTSFALPEVNLKARILAPGREPTALIEVNESLYLVRKGSEITLQGRGLQLTGARPADGRASRRGATGLTNYTLRVTGIDADEVRIEITRLNETITIR